MQTYILIAYRQVALDEGSENATLKESAATLNETIKSNGDTKIFLYYIMRERGESSRNNFRIQK